MGRLDCRIVEARNLPDTQLISKPDPYVKVKLENLTHKTRVMENNLNPKWDEVFKFTVADENTSQLKLELWNSNVVSDEFLGQYHVSLSGLTRGVVRDEWFLLQQCKTNAEIRVRLLATDFGKDPTPEQLAAIGKTPQTVMSPGMQQQGAYPPQHPPQGAYPAQQGAYPPQQPPQGAYPAQQVAYPPVQPAQGAYPPPQGGYPPVQGGYPPQQPGYPPQQGGYPPQQPGYAPQQFGGYPPAQPGYPPVQYAQGYPPQQPGYGY